MDSAGSALASEGYTAVVANCIAAKCYDQAAELCTHFLSQGEIAVGQGGDRAIRGELAMLVIYHGHAIAFDLDPFLRIVLTPRGESKEKFIRWFLGVVPASEFSTYALSLLNASRATSDPAVSETLIGIVSEVAELLPQGPERKAVLSLIQLHLLKHRADHGVPLPPEEELLTAWEDRKDLWVYAAVLKLLIEKGLASAMTLTKAYGALDHDADEDSASAHLHLAMELAEQIKDDNADRKQRSIVLEYLKGGIHKWEPYSTVETNLAVYRLLTQLDENNRGSYISRLVKWQKIKIERDHLKLLRQLANQRKYLLIFREYCDSASFWGLRSDPPEEGWRSFARSDFNTGSELWRSWSANGSRVPNPLMSKSHAVVSAKFLSIGYCLFSPPNITDPRYDLERSQFDEAAKKALPELLRLILGLPGMPKEIRDLLAYHSTQLFTSAGLIVQRIAVV